MRADRADCEGFVDRGAGVFGVAEPGVVIAPVRAFQGLLDASAIGRDVAADHVHACPARRDRIVARPVGPEGRSAVDRHRAYHALPRPLTMMIVRLVSAIPPWGPVVSSVSVTRPSLCAWASALPRAFSLMITVALRPAGMNNVACPSAPRIGGMWVRRRARLPWLTTSSPEHTTRPGRHRLLTAIEARYAAPAPDCLSLAMRGNLGRASFTTVDLGSSERAWQGTMSAKRESRNR